MVKHIAAFAVFAAIVLVFNLANLPLVPSLAAGFGVSVIIDYIFGLN